MAQTIYLNMIPNTPTPRVYFSQYDVGEAVNFVLFYDTAEYAIPTGATVTIQGTKPSGFGFTDTCEYSGNVASIEVTADMTAEAGNVLAEIIVTLNDNMLGSKNFIMAIEKAAHPHGTIDDTPAEVLPQLTQLVERVEDAAESIHDLTVDATTLSPSAPATAVYDDETNNITFGIPRGSQMNATDDGNGNITLSFS